MDTRYKILNTAYKLFAEKGFDRVSIRDITGKAGVNLGAVTYHFGGKNQLSTAIILEKTAPLMEIGKKVAESGLGPREKLSQLLRESAMHILHDDPYLKVVFAETIHGGQRMSPEALEPLKKRNQLIAGMIQEGVDTGIFQPVDVECATWVYFGMLVPFVLHQPLITPERRLGAYPKEYVNRAAETAIKLFFDGLEST